MAPTTATDSIITLMARSLPSSNREIKDGYAAIALLYHASMLDAGFRLIGLGDEGRIGMFFFISYP